MYRKVLELVNEQTEDQRLWNPENPTEAEAILQNALRELHELIELYAGISPADHIKPSAARLH